MPPNNGVYYLHHAIFTENKFSKFFCYFLIIIENNNE